MLPAILLPACLPAPWQPTCASKASTFFKPPLSPKRSPKPRWIHSHTERMSHFVRNRRHPCPPETAQIDAQYRLASPIPNSMQQRPPPTTASTGLPISPAQNVRQAVVPLACPGCLPTPCEALLIAGQTGRWSPWSNRTSTPIPAGLDSTSTKAYRRNSFKLSQLPPESRPSQESPS